MAERSKKECNKLINEILKSFKEYSTEDCDINEKSVKSEILHLLNTHRPVKLVDYEYGLSHALKKDHRIIVREEGDRSKVREFRKDLKSNGWYCSYKYSGSVKCSSPTLKIKYGIVFAPIHHNGVCQVKNYSFVMKIQELLKQGKTSQAQSFANNSSKKNSMNNNSNQSLSTSTLIDADVALFSPASDGPFLNNDHQSSLSRRRSTRIAKQSSTKKSQKQKTYLRLDNCQNNSQSKRKNAILTKQRSRKQPQEQKMLIRLISSLRSDDISGGNVSFINGTSTDLSVDQNESTINLLGPRNGDTTSITNLTLQSNNETVLALPTNFNAAGSASILNLRNSKRKMRGNIRKNNENCATVKVKKAKVENRVEDNNDCVIIDERPADIRQTEHSKTTFPFESPSTSTLKEICQKLKINYNKEAHKLWSMIEFEEISIISANLKLHHFKTKNIFECFSLLFIGATNQFFQIQHVINEAFRDKLVHSGKMSQHEIDQLVFSSTVSDDQLAFIAKFLKCRFAIYKKSKLCRFGNWDSEGDILTLVLAYFDGFYSIVLNL